MAESLSNEEGKYSTIELYFSRPDYHILVEEVNSLSQLPLGMRTYFAPSVSIFDKNIIQSECKDWQGLNFFFENSSKLKIQVSGAVCL